MGEIAAEVKIEDISSVEKKLSFEIPWAEVKSELDEAYRTIGKKAKVKGFRPGKTPRRILETHYNREAEDETITNLISKSYADALETNKIMAVSQPVIDQKGIEIDKVFSFTATVEVEPVFEPKNYIGFEVEKEEREVTDSDVDARIEQLRQVYSTLETIEEDREVREDDFVTIDFEGKVEEVARKELTAENYLLQMGSKMFFPGFEEQLLGVKKGEQKEITIKLSEDYPKKDFAGKGALFSVTVKDIKEKRLPELDEDFIKNFEVYETVDDLKKEIMETLEKETEAAVKNSLRSKIIDKLIENNEFEIPSTYVNRQIYYMMLDAERRMINNGMNPEKAREISSNLHERFEGEATRMVKTSLLLNKIAEIEKVAVEEKDVEGRLHELAQQFAQDYESVKTTYENNNLMERLKEELLEQKTLEYIEARANLKVVKKDDVEKEGEE